MPNATAPNAPCVDVWLSPHAIVIPGCVRPSSGPMTWTMPWSSLPETEQRHAELPAVALEGRQHLLRHPVREGTGLPVGGHDVVDRRERPVREGDALAAQAEHVEGLGAGDLVHEVQADQELRLARRQAADRVKVPDLPEQCGAHPGFGL